ncbi:hypothetical protein CASFOL_002500 [Castilleja foliolosa]|uniref:Uncharacterized protein n=1 Tax=Castilleja foliolosa TaxID=1961234 RepID=A0ABD3EIF9_9LAMI
MQFLVTTEANPWPASNLRPLQNRPICLENPLLRRNYSFIRRRLRSPFFPSAPKPYAIPLQRIDKGLFQQQNPH